MDLLSPKFHKVLTPGKSYTGGKTFFEDNTDLIISIPEREVFHHKNNQLPECPQSLINALQIFICGVAITVNIQGKENFLSMLIHADSLKDVSRQFYDWVKMLKDSWEDILQLPNGDPSKSELIEQFKENYFEAVRRIDNPPSFNVVIEEVLQVILDTNIELVIAGSREIDWSNATAHILVGADMLNRGFTVENLAVTYMPRHTKGKSNADTIQQRCRFFGYKQKYFNSCRVYLPTDSITEYVDYVAHEQEMRNWLKKSDSLINVQQQLILSEKLSPTRKNILPFSIVQSKMKGWHAMNALQFIESNKEVIEIFFTKNHFTLWEPQYGTSDRNHKISKVSVDKAIELLTQFKFGNYADTARKQATIRYLQYLAEEIKSPISNVNFIQMAYESEYRERSFNQSNLKIDQLFTGRSTTGSQVYPGDRDIKNEDTIYIQIHKIKLKCKEINKYVGKIIYTIAIYYPSDFAIGYTSVEPEILTFEDDE